MTKPAVLAPHRGLFALSVLAAAVPFGFALIRAVTTGRDLRYFWLALASLLGGMVTMAFGRSFRGKPGAVVVLPVAVFIVATLCTVLAALLIGTTLGLGLIVVAAGFGFCVAAGAFLQILAHRR